MGRVWGESMLVRKKIKDGGTIDNRSGWTQVEVDRAQHAHLSSTFNEVLVAPPSSPLVKACFPMVTMRDPVRTLPRDGDR